MPPIVSRRRTKYPDFSGVYCIFNITKRKAYVGRSTGIKNRIAQHMRDLKRGAHIVQEMQKDFDAGDVFTGFTLLRLPEFYRTNGSREEAKYQEFFKSWDKEHGYNYKEQRYKNPHSNKETKNIIRLKGLMSCQTE